MKNIHDDVERILFTSDEITARCKELGSELSEYYKDSKPLVVGLLRGSVPFMSELIKYITVPMEIDFMSVSSYEGTESSGYVCVKKDLDRTITDEKILLVEDIVDTGRTLTTVKELLLKKGASEVKIITLLDKPERRVVELQPDYTGFVIPNEFVIGYGLDYNQLYRNLPYVGVIKQSAIKE